MPAYDQAVGIVRARRLISRVGVPQYEEAPVGFGSLFGRNITLTGGPAPVRAYIEELLPDVLDGTINPGKVFDPPPLDDVPAGYRAMDDREASRSSSSLCDSERSAIQALRRPLSPSRRVPSRHTYELSTPTSMDRGELG